MEDAVKGRPFSFCGAEPHAAMGSLLGLQAVFEEFTESKSWNKEVYRRLERFKDLRPKILAAVALERSTDDENIRENFSDERAKSYSSGACYYPSYITYMYICVTGASLKDPLLGWASSFSMPGHAGLEGL